MSIPEEYKMLMIEQYFRPSRLPILNVRDLSVYFYGEVPRDIVLPDELYRTPEDTLINYFSVLREAARPIPGNRTGCGTIGYAQKPYPVAYNFLSTKLQENLDYNQFLTSFDNILHINLIKLRQIPADKNYSNSIRFFVEFETIEGSMKEKGYFAYYYSFITVILEENQYRILASDNYEENFLCAPYHGWDFEGEAVVDIKYGTWCSLVEVRYPTMWEDYVKKIPFQGTDGKEYMIVFFELTNGTDIEIAQYVKNEKGEWIPIYINPEDCLYK